MSDELCFASVDRLEQLIARREVSVEEVVRASLEQIERLDPAVNAVVALRSEAALAEARAADRASASGGPPASGGDPIAGPLHGIPFTVKDVTETLDLPTTYGSVAFAGHRSEFDAVIVTRLRAAGAILVGKTNTSELACEPVTRGELLGDTVNPWAPERTPGGSSGGAAAGLATGMFTLALGTDAGGSIRIPAACCGVVGIKPTRGLVTFEPMARDPWGGLLHNGPLARSCRDTAAMLDVIADRSQSCRAACERPLKPLRVACSSHLDGGTLDPEVATAFADTVKLLEELGLEIVEDHPDVSALPELFATIAEAAFAAIGEELSDDQLSRVGLSVLQLTRRGWRISAADYCVALQSAYRESLRIMRFWDGCDVLVTPTVPWTPPLRAVFPSTEDYDAKWSEYGVWEAFTSPWNVTGQPAISLPCPALTAPGLPVGLQLVGRCGAEAQLFTLAAAYEAAAGWDDRRPALATGVGTYEPDARAGAPASP
ncbi:MAG: amidase [Solirubrobacteraceae bacterium]